jgi:predicted metal-binding membrane protein
LPQPADPAKPQLSAPSSSSEAVQAADLPGYGLAWLTGWLTGQHPAAAHVLAGAVFARCGIYQLSNLKDRCLAHCRCP